MQAIVLATIPLSVGFVACGGSSTSGPADAGTGGPCFGGPAPQPRTIRMPYTPLCPGNAGSVDAGEAGMPEASADAAIADGSAEDAAVDAGVCIEEQVPSCTRLCGAFNPSTGEAPTGHCSIVVSDGGEKMVDCEVLRECGRPYEGLKPPPRDENASSVARWLARCAYLEDASVGAFRILARELAHHGAPRALVRRAKQSERDEVRHTRVMQTLARRHGAHVTRADKPRRAARDLERVLIENAVHGCVHETWSALLAMYQGKHAAAKDIRAAMRAVAMDETRHAALAWDIAAWGEAMLDGRAKRRVHEARCRAYDELTKELRAQPAEALVARAGFPTPALAVAMLSALGAALGVEATCSAAA